MENPFGELPRDFFAPLAFANREHYANLLIVYYQLFLEYHDGVERPVVMSAFEEYFAGLGDLSSFEEDSVENDRAGERVIHEDLEEESAVAGETQPLPALDPRMVGNYFLRRLIRCGWMSEEEMEDYTQRVNMTSWAKPFFDALYRIAQGVGVEYESHVVAIYSSLCGDAAGENGHHAVLNAHYHTRLLIESLKVLAQNIKNHLQRIYDHDMAVKDILHIHYDVYMREVVDRAYNRLKTSDNLSKYRPRINAAVNEFLRDEEWLAASARKLSVIKRLPVEETRRFLIGMLKEIREELHNIDPILEEIDDKNRRYSRITTERIKTKIHTDVGLYGKIRAIADSLLAGDLGTDDIRHGIWRNRYLDSGSLYTRRVRKMSRDAFRRPEDDVDTEIVEREMFLRISGQLNPKKVAGFLDGLTNRSREPYPASRAVKDIDSFIRVMYAAAYAEGRAGNFPYVVRWEEGVDRVDRFEFRRHSFIRDAK